jgi:nucleoside-diphosphate-sugar epimerase
LGREATHFKAAVVIALVTGGGGFLGRYIVEQLVARGDAVRSLQRGDYPELAALGVEQIRADIRDRDAVVSACRRVDAVFHVAAIAGIWGPWRRYFEINTLGTRHVIDGCRQHGARKLVFCSSPSVTFDGTDQCNVDESAPYPTKWLCHYPHTKALAEQEVLAANGKQDLLTCALRPHLIWGPRDQHLIPRLIERARSGQLRRVGDGTNLVDMVYVENAAEAHLLAADALEPGAAACGKAYFISQGEPVNCWAWINDILALAKLPPIHKSISARAAWHVGRLMELAHTALRIDREPRMTRFLAAQLSTSHYFNLAAAKRDLGYAPRISTADGMQRLAEELAAVVH